MYLPWPTKYRQDRAVSWETWPSSAFFSSWFAPAHCFCLNPDQTLTLTLTFRHGGMCWISESVWEVTLVTDWNSMMELLDSLSESYNLWTKNYPKPVGSKEWFSWCGARWLVLRFWKLGSAVGPMPSTGIAQMNGLFFILTVIDGRGDFTLSRLSS